MYESEYIIEYDYEYNNYPYGLYETQEKGGKVRIGLFKNKKEIEEEIEKKGDKENNRLDRLKKRCM